MTDRNRGRGFTLVEMMAVVVIIGILATIVGTGTVFYITSAKIKATKAQISEIKTALATFHATANRYPSTSEGLAALKSKPADWGEEYWPEEGLMSEIPKDGWGRDFVYLCPGATDKPYDVISYGADGKEGGDSADADISN
jgi:general secretion pathway protein G